MQVLQGTEELSGVESTSVLVELSLPLQMVEQFSPVDYTSDCQCQATYLN